MPFFQNEKRDVEDLEKVDNNENVLINPLWLDLQCFGLLIRQGKETTTLFDEDLYPPLLFTSILIIY